jgi:hypothetical protein
MSGVVRGEGGLPAPARYFPFEKGLYEVAPGLRVFGTDFGNGPLDQKIFQLDSAFPEFRASKLACRADRLSKYYCEHEYPREVARAVTGFLIDRLVQESPGYFSLERMPGGESWLGCALTGEQLRFDPELKLLPGTCYESALDALASQVSEDLNVLALSESGDRNWLCAMHVSSPSTWRPEEKIGKDFYGIHEPVAQSEALLKASKGIVSAMVFKGPYVRFNWGLTMDPRPNHHPDLPRGLPLTELGDENPPYMWVERQTVWGLPAARASLFTIRISMTDLREVRADPARRAQLVSTIRSMSPALLEYKGFDECRDRLLSWLA